MIKPPNLVGGLQGFGRCRSYSPPKRLCSSTRTDLYGYGSNLPKSISEINFIPQDTLLRTADVHRSSVVERVSWVSCRQTTKPENIAYCLMGLFGINMPLLYGERETSAFKWLQMEILKESDDTSIFARATSRDGFDTEIAENQAFTLLAGSPTHFRLRTTLLRRICLWRQDMPKVSGQQWCSTAFILHFL